MNRARILLADDHKEMRDRVKRYLEREFEVVEAVDNGRALLEAASKLRPDVCLLDISMPILNGIETAIQLKERGSTAKILFLTIHEDLDFVQAALKGEPVQKMPWASPALTSSHAPPATSTRTCCRCI